jgi:hypothetical protein
VTLRRAAIVALVSTCSLSAAATAHAAATDFDFSYSTYPGDYTWDGGGTPAPPQTFGDYDGSVSQDYAADGTALCGPTTVDGYTPSCDVQQVRGGAVIPDSDPATGKSLPVSLAAGDVIQLVNRTTKAVVGATAVAVPQPVIASPIGSASFTIGRTATTSIVSASLMRRVPRNVLRDTVIPGTYHYAAEPTGTPDDDLATCYPYNPNTQTVTPTTDAAPTKPTGSAGTGKIWALVQDTPCAIGHTQIPGNPYEEVSTGRLTNLGDASFTGSFSVPMQAGDLIAYTVGTETIANDVNLYVSQTNVVPVGVVPPAPVVKGFQLGAATTTVKAFLKGGLRTFVTLDSPATVTEQLTVPAPVSKKKSKKHKKKAAPKPPIVIATGTATTTAAGQTAQVTLFSTKDGRKVLKALGGKPAKTTMTTTITDAYGHTVTSTSALKLSGS